MSAAFAERPYVPPRQDYHNFPLESMPPPMHPTYFGQTQHAVAPTVGQGCHVPFYHQPAWMQPLPPQYPYQPRLGIAPNPYESNPRPSSLQIWGRDYAPNSARKASPNGHGLEEVPTTPRGPPPKPKRSGHALWVGNLPSGAKINDIKNHFAAGATDYILSAFLISKSNCAFVNYKTEQACANALRRFHNSQFAGKVLVCRLRRSSSDFGESQSGASLSPIKTPSEVFSKENSTPSPTTGKTSELDGPLIVRGSMESQPESPTVSVNIPPVSPSPVSDRFFILKSLTTADLIASQRNHSWATQPHNVDVLNAAFASADNVYLFFSANKTGGYFGFARMTSSIRDSTERSAPSAADALVPTSPKSIPTPPTATAPSGRIVDDSARGIIFWEADSADVEGQLRDEAVDDGGWGGEKEFSVEWISSTRLPFYRTRGLRNPWNCNREIKIARDGTEIEPSVGKRLMGLFESV